MKIHVTENDNARIITPEGRIDSETSEAFGRVLKDAVKEKADIILDFHDVDYISSSGLRVLLAAKKELPEESTCRLINVREVVLEVFELTGFSDLFEIEVLGGIDASDIRVLFFDVDGTLLSHTTGQVPESTKQAVAAARAAGIKTVIATGRAIEELKLLPVMELPFDAYLTLNGNICLNDRFEMFAGNEIDPGEVEILVGIFKAGRIPFVLIGENKRYINYVDNVVIRTQMETHGTIPDIGEYKGEKIYQCLAFVDAGMRQKLENMLDHCTITSWNETGIDIIAKTGGKAAGIQAYLDLENLRRAQSMAFGDGENDIPMIHFAGIGVAMGNGTEGIRAAADYVTTSIDEDGIAHALKHFQLI